MKAPLYSLPLLTACAALSLGAISPAFGQVSDDIVVNILRQCAKIDDPTSRLACYDNNIREGGSDEQGPVVPGEGSGVSGGSAPLAASGPIASFGAKGIKSPERFASGETQNRVDQITAQVKSVSERQPGIWLVTLEDGAEWLFSNSVRRSYRPPRRGSTIEIERASLGSFLMIVDNQQAVRVRRIK